MSTEYPLKRFESVDDAEAWEHGPGAFSWAVNTGGYRYIEFLYPDKTTGTIELGSVPICPSWRNRACWEWNGDEDAPVLTPSLLTRKQDHKTKEFQEVFHGWIKGTVLEVL